jgi:2-methylisocitrate lyase-like PEP mutase family enzyme
LAEAGAKRISVGSALARLAYGNLIRAAREMAAKGTFALAAEAMAFAEVERHFHQRSQAGSPWPMPPPRGADRARG